jgi:hypothetical protein
VRDVVGLYINPPDHAVVLSVTPIRGFFRLLFRADSGAED